MKKKNEILLIVASLIMFLSLFSDYQINYYEGIRKDSIEYSTFMTTNYIAGKLYCDEEYVCPGENLSFAEFQNEYLDKYIEQGDSLRGYVSFYQIISKILILLSMGINIFVLISESKSQRKNGKHNN